MKLKLIALFCFINFLNSSISQWNNKVPNYSFENTTLKDTTTIITKKNHELFIEALGPGGHGSLGYSYVINKNKLQIKPTIGLGGTYSNIDFFQAYVIYLGITVSKKLNKRFSINTTFNSSLILRRSFVFPNLTESCIGTGYVCPDFDYLFINSIGIGTGLMLTERFFISLTIHTNKFLIKEKLYLFPSLKLTYKL